MATAVTAAISEIDDRLARFAPELEGLLDFQRLNLEATTQDDIAAAIHAYQQRVSYLTAARMALAALDSDGHPDLPLREIDDSALVDLQANAATIQAALAMFRIGLASGLGLSVGVAEPKS